MGRLNASMLALALGLAATLGLAACGGSDPELLPGRTASEIEANLDSVARLAAEGECVGAADTAQAVSSQVEGLGGVDGKLKRALEEGAQRLNEVVAGCEEEEPVEEELEAEEPEEEVEPATKAEKHEKPEKPGKPSKEEPEAEEPEEEGSPELPPQANGKGKGLEKGGGPPSESGGEPPSGGVGPGTAVEGGE